VEDSINVDLREINFTNGWNRLRITSVVSAETFGFSDVEPLESATRNLTRQVDIDRQIDKQKYFRHLVCCYGKI
jgi:hypothetical protein